MTQEPEIIIRLNLPANHKYLNVLGACIVSTLERANGPENDVTFNVQLAAQEISTNIIKYAYAGEPGCIDVTITLKMRQSPRQLVVETADTGPHTFIPSQVPEPELMGEGGRGLYLVCRLMDDIVYCSREGIAWRYHSEDASWQTVETAYNYWLPQHNYWRLVKTF